jgi:hypothetical protein
MGKLRIASNFDVIAPEVQTRSVVIPTFNFGEPKQEVLTVEVPVIEKVTEIEYRDVVVPVEKIEYIDRVVEKIIEVPVEKIVEKLVEVEKIVNVEIEKIVEIEKVVERIVEVESKELQELVQLQHTQLKNLEDQVSIKSSEVSKLKYIMAALVIIAIIGVLV